MMPEENERATRFAVLVFLSRVYLTQGDYANALAAADDVIQSDYFKMNAAVTAVFSKKNAAQSIGEIQQNEQDNAGTSAKGMATFYASLPGIGRADASVTRSFITNNYPTDDLRASE